MTFSFWCMQNTANTFGLSDRYERNIIAASQNYRMHNATLPKIVVCFPAIMIVRPLCV